MYRSHYHYNSNGMSIGWTIAIIIICFFVAAIADEISVSSSREDNNMIYIEKGYCYDADTKIIYRETIINGGKYNSDTSTYSPYINENGNYCKYQNGRWIEFVK